MDGNKNSLIFVGILCCALLACSERESTSVRRPASVPDHAIWVGAADGGNYFDCNSTTRAVLRCRIYTDTGQLMMDQEFVNEAQAELPMQIQLQGFDGAFLNTGNAGRLIPKRSAAVTAEAQYALGYWVWCKVLSTELLSCKVVDAFDLSVKEDGQFKVKGAKVSDVLPLVFESYSGAGTINLKNGLNLVRSVR